MIRSIRKCLLVYIRSTQDVLSELEKRSKRKKNFVPLSAEDFFAYWCIHSLFCDGNGQAWEKERVSPIKRWNMQRLRRLLMRIFHDVKHILVLYLFYISYPSHSGCWNKGKSYRKLNFRAIMYKSTSKHPLSFLWCYSYGGQDASESIVELCVRRYLFTVFLSGFKTELSQNFQRHLHL